MLRGTRARWPLGRLAGAPLALAALIVALSASAAQAAPVPCSAGSAGKYYCTFYVKGDGFSAGAPVQSSGGTRVGYLNYGQNWVICQSQGAEQTSGPYHNDWWAYTEANDGQWGWVDALWASGGSNDGQFGGGVPACGSAHGYPPGGAPSSGGGSGPAPVPCAKGSGASFDCNFYPPGNGFSGGSPVEDAGAHVIGYLNVGSNFVVCQQTGATLSSGAYHNDWWAYTEANDGRYGWVNALYGSGGDNNGAFQSVPGCNGAHGATPSGTIAPPPPQPPPPPPPVPGNLDSVRQKIVSVALSQNGYNPDRDGCSRYSTLMCPGHPDQGEWCSIFATWTWDQANVLPGNLIPILAYSGDPYHWAAQNTYVLPESRTPKPGDLVSFGSGPGFNSDGSLQSLHVAVILQVMPSGALLVMNGNGGTGDGVATESTFFPSNPTASGEPGPVYGYASPVNDGGGARDFRGLSAAASPFRRDAQGQPQPVAGQDPRTLSKLARKIARRHPAFQHMPYVGRRITIEILNVRRHGGKIVVAVLHRGSKRAAERRFRAFLTRYHDRGHEYVVRYHRTHR